MSAFKLPKSFCADLDSLVRKFWWSPTKESNRFYSPMAWSKLCRPLSAGGLVFRSFQSSNEPIIAKLAWWVLSSQDSFCVRILRAKCKVGSKLLVDRPASSASYSWRGLKSCKSLLIKGACKLVGSGEIF